jgi:Fic family protein
MNISDFRCSESGRIHRSIDGIDTFVPAFLPPAISYDPQLVLALSKADTALSELSGVGRQLPNPHLLITPYLRQEAILSSRIEGTRASLSEMLLDEMDEFDGDATGEAERQEVRNYIHAMELGIQELREGRPISLNLAKELHAQLMIDVRGKLSSPGRFRTIQNWIGASNSDVHSAEYVPPPPELLMDLLSDWERFLNTSGEMPDLIQCAILHEQFEAIHPFLDGNGRMGRLLITLFLMERGRLSQPLLYLSSYIEPRRRDYYDLLQRVRTDGAWDTWIRFFLTGVEHTARQAVQQTKQLMDLREDFRYRIRSKPRALALVDYLFGNPFITAKRAQQFLDVSDPTARAAIGALMDVNILTEWTERSWRRLYVSSPVLEILSAVDQPETSSGL